MLQHYALRVPPTILLSKHLQPHDPDIAALPIATWTGSRLVARIWTGGRVWILWLWWPDTGGHMHLWWEHSTAFTRKTPEVSLLAANYISTTDQLRKEDKRNLVPQFPHWPNKDNDATYSRGLFSILSEMINVDVHCLAPSKCWINVS